MNRYSPGLRLRHFLTILLVTYSTRGGGLVFAPYGINRIISSMWKTCGY
jgi:hypothetical protein